jgi:hypothetical protein
MAYSGLFLGSSLSAIALCFACSNSTFEAGGESGSAGAAGAPHAGGGSAGDSNAAGTSSGGTSSGGSSGATDSGGTASAGASGAVTGNGGASAGTGGTPAGGATSMGGSGGADCASLKAEYSAAVAKARVCDAGSTDECSKSSLPALGCGCPTLVNAKSTYTTVAQKLHDQIEADKCSTGAICDIACVPYTGASCAASTSATDMAYVCTSSLAAAAN